MFILSTWHSAGNQTFITNREEMFHSAVTFVSFWKGNLSVDLSRTGSNEPPLTKKKRGVIKADISVSACFLLFNYAIPVALHPDHCHHFVVNHE